MSAMHGNARTGSLPGFEETDNTADTPGKRAPLVLHMDKFHQVTRQVCQVAEATRPPFA